MAGDEGGVAGEVEPGLGAQHGERGEAHRHQRRLGVGGQRQLRFRPLEHQGRKRLPERLIDLGEYVACLGEKIGQGLAHADGLRPLAGEHEGLHRANG